MADEKKTTKKAVAAKPAAEPKTSGEVLPDSRFNRLVRVDVNEHTETISDQGRKPLTYLSWVWAWRYVKERYPDASYKVYETPEGCIYWHDGRTAWVKVSVTIEGEEIVEYLPVMDYRNNSLPLAKVTSWDVNKTIQRALTKAIARHGLGLYIYAGEDLPEKPAEQPAPSTQQDGPAKDNPSESLEYKPLDEETYWKVVKAHAFGETTKSGQSLKRWFIRNTHAGADEIAKFDHDVENVKIANNLKNS